MEKYENNCIISGYNYVFITIFYSYSRQLLFFFLWGSNDRCKHIKNCNVETVLTLIDGWANITTKLHTMCTKLLTNLKDYLCNRNSPFDYTPSTKYFMIR